MEEGRRILATSEFRVLAGDKRKQLTLFLGTYSCTQTLLGELFYMTQQSVSRHVRAIKAGRAPGKRVRPTALTPEQEERVADVTAARSAKKNCLSPSEVRQEALKVISDGVDERLVRNGAGPELHRSWARDFIRRRKEQFKTAPRRGLETERIEASMVEVQHYYATLRRLFDEHKYDPCLIANMDETMLEIGDSNKRSVVSRSRGKDPKYGYVEIKNVLFHMTLVATIFGNNTSGKPLVIIPSTLLPPDVSNDSVLNYTALAGQDSGWITEQIFLGWVTDMFIPEIEARRRVLNKPDARALLLADGHSSRASPEALDLLAEHSIDMVTPVSHSSHVCQALDLLFFAAFKQGLSGLRWTIKTSSRPDFRKSMINAAIVAYHRASFADTIAGSWQRAGIVPFDPSVPLAHDALVEQPPAAAASPTRPIPALNINNQIITSPAKRDELRAEKTRLRREAATKKKREMRQAKKKADVVAQAAAAGR